MSDLLVKLYTLPDARELREALALDGIEIKRALAPEKHHVLAWVGEKFSKGWASECDAAFAHAPCSCFIAVKDAKIIGFACYDATARGFFGPIGVDEDLRKAGLGKALLIRTLEAMREAGYGYAVIGWAGPVNFFAKTVGATVIEGSEPGVYKNMIKG
jgi:GNAT superfamily N-acetyltransferase